MPCFPGDIFAEWSLQTINDRQSTDPMLINRCILLFQTIHFDHFSLSYLLPVLPYSISCSPHHKQTNKQTNTKTKPLTQAVEACTSSNQTKAQHREGVSRNRNKVLL